MIREVLSEPYALCMSPGFFKFYTYVGILAALEEEGLLNVTHVSGSSAGALVGGFLATGLKPCEMIDRVLKIRREDMWDLGAYAGLLKGQKFQEILQDQLLVQHFEETIIPIGVCSYDIFRFKTNIITNDCNIDLATAIRASCCVPILFTPVMINNSPNIDGGLFDRAGLLGLPGVPSSQLIVNIVSGRETISSSILPEKYKDCRLLTIVVEMNHPFVTPFNMATQGEIAVNMGKLSMQNALDNGHVEQIGTSNNHWVIYLDGNVSPTAASASSTGSDHLKDIKTTYSFVKSLSQSSLSEMAEDSVVERATTGKAKKSKPASSKAAQNGQKNTKKTKKAVK